MRNCPAMTEAEFDAFVQNGLDAANRGDVVSQDEMERWFEQRAQRSVDINNFPTPAGDD